LEHKPLSHPEMRISTKQRGEKISGIAKGGGGCYGKESTPVAQMGAIGGTKAAR